MTVGYWCEVDDAYEPPAHRDGLLFRISMPDTSLLSNDREVFEELSGQLGLLDVARLAVDGRVYAWEYEPVATRGGWYLEGDMRFLPTVEVAEEAQRADFLKTITGLYESSAPVLQRIQPEIDDFAARIREEWTPAYDYAASHYFGRDTVGIELKEVVHFPLSGLEAAADSVRFWCPVPQGVSEWNGVRTAFLSTLDSLHRTAEERTANEAARRAAAERAAAARAAEERAAERAAAARAAEERAAERAAAAERRAAAERADAELRTSASIVWSAFPESVPPAVVPDFLAFASMKGIEIRTSDDVRRTCGEWFAVRGPSATALRLRIPMSQRGAARQICDML
ncbi:MAG: hypothetical protein OXQ29_02645 [Rhodospirillaceae bacterium]|nr:hypothetical protein [Rhodospirillaceae bacterium]